MTKEKFNIIFILLISYCLFGQSDPVLFSVDNSKVHLSEFEYIYSKNNGKEADYSEESLLEYLDLYTKFKLKVAEARSKKIDTLKTYIDELAGYRRQLADSYIVDKELARRIAEEAYERMQKDISFSHILIELNVRAAPGKVKLAREKMERVQSELKKGKSFEALAIEFSEDKKTKDKGGKVGLMTAILPDGYYELETALYNTSKGAYSDIIRTNLGFHIVRIDGVRKARGRMSVAHILIRKKFKGVENPEAKKQIEKIYQELKKGASFEMRVFEKTQDNNTKEKGGKLGEFGIGKYEKAFEDAAFALKKDGDISKPVETSTGYHIIKRLGKTKLTSFDEMKDELIKRTDNRDRQEAGKNLLNEEIKKEAGHKCYDDVLNSFINSLDQSFYRYNWSLPAINSDVLCKLGSEKYSMLEFASFCKNRGRDRMQYSDDTPLRDAVMELYEEFISEKSIDYQQKRLEKKYIDFRNLMREYEEGILLFEITKEEVWDKASKDNEGIQKYYGNNKEKYIWNERAEVTNYSIRSTDMAIISKILKTASKQSPDKVLEGFNGAKDDVKTSYVF